MPIKVIIVEDDIHALENLQKLISVETDIQLLATATTLAQADELCLALKPDLVFCDVMVPPSTSFDWLMNMDSIPFDLIFTTSFEEFAVKAFRIAAIDYLVKPIVSEELNAALEKYRKKSLADGLRIGQLLKNLSAPKVKSKLALPTFTGYTFVDIADIIRCESDNTYTTFYFSNREQIIVSKTLKEVEGMLEDYGFCRVHNSHLVNLALIKEYFKGEGGQVKLADGSVVDVSRRRKEDFLSKLR
ncbi:two component transcriptional regulator, LytTR family [Algoriphagus locisalis]|uniref:Two component transcriptional regulator, LytTR family n=1 Tax=Algoriphagus locisalis TaxID=305507 RepID=A0A1I6XSY7_9BACT|nr:LytTR family DNA-binding domain-containing protein [Algoriphagus locisalis]SFT41163.1 two component transcriptional regulator, LytTR family [Algoriphagus locisalis]